MPTLEAPRPFDALAARVGAAAGRLPEQQRTALKLRETDGASYEAIAAALEIDPAEIPQLLVSARMAVRGAVRHVPEPPHLTEYCADARRLLSLRQDGEYLSQGETEWLRGHVERCDGCRVARRALREATLACRAWDGAPAVFAPPAAGPGTTEASGAAAPAGADDATPPATVPGEAAADGDGPAGAPDAPPAQPETRMAPGHAPVPALPVPASRRPRSAVGAPVPTSRRRRVLGVATAGALAATVAAVAVTALGGEAPSSAGDVAPAAATAAPKPDASRSPASPRPDVTVSDETLARRRAAARKAAREERRRLAAVAERRRAATRARRQAAAARRAAQAQATPRATPEPVASTPRRRSDGGRQKAPQPGATATPRPAAPQPTSTPTPRPRPSATPRPSNTPAPTPKPDIIPPDGDEFCFEDDPDC